jgi:hypothetical protein
MRSPYFHFAGLRGMPFGNTVLDILICTVIIASLRRFKPSCDLLWHAQATHFKSRLHYSGQTV